MTEQRKRNIVTVVIISIFVFFAFYQPRTAESASKGIRIIANVVRSYELDHDAIQYRIVEDVYCNDSKETKISAPVKNDNAASAVMFVRKCVDGRVSYSVDSSYTNSKTFKQFVPDGFSVEINKKQMVIEP
ncbi:MAG: hypothetical protein ACRC3J_09300 [Culicoidibacterales bacterium]